VLKFTKVGQIRITAEILVLGWWTFFPSLGHTSVIAGQ